MFSEEQITTGKECELSTLKVLLSVDYGNVQGITPSIVSS